jgi:hypothetical protein
MYKYLRLNESYYQSTHELGATIFFVLKNQQSIDIVKWFVLKVLFGDFCFMWVLCALEEGCMAPKGSTIACNGQKISTNWKEHDGM